MHFAIKGLMTISILASLLVSTANLFAADDSEDIYKAKCQMCHGPNGEPTGAGKAMGAKPFSDPDVQKMSDEELAGITANGKNKMPAYKSKLSDDQIKALIKYIRALK